LELGSSNSIKNLWPQSYRKQPWNAHVKDALENELHDEVCSGQMDLKAAQQAIASNWIDAYKRVFHTDLPLRSVGCETAVMAGAAEGSTAAISQITVPLMADRDAAAPAARSRRAGAWRIPLKSCTRISGRSLEWDLMRGSVAA
jgi:hypothetical protein